MIGFIITTRIFLILMIIATGFPLFANVTSFNSKPLNKKFLLAFSLAFLSLASTFSAPLPAAPRSAVDDYIECIANLTEFNKGDPELLRQAEPVCKEKVSTITYLDKK